MGELETLQENGYCQVPYALNEAERADFAKISATVIDLALTDPRIQEALTFSLIPEYRGRVNPTRFTVSGAKNSDDDKTWVHLGYLSQIFADSQIPERNQPTELRALWDPLNTKLAELEKSARYALANLGLNSWIPLLFHPDPSKRVILSRTIKYHHALSAEAGEEVVSGHADQSVATLHEYETHGGWFRAAPYAQDLMLDEDTDQRAAAVRDVRAAAVPIASDLERTASFFLGVGAKRLCEAYDRAHYSLPGAYHLGVRPQQQEEALSAFAQNVSQTDRVSVVSFIHPHTDIFRAGRYVLASVKQCRPSY